MIPLVLHSVSILPQYSKHRVFLPTEHAAGSREAYEYVVLHYFRHWYYSPPTFFYEVPTYRYLWSYQIAQGGVSSTLPKANVSI